MINTDGFVDKKAPSSIHIHWIPLATSAKMQKKLLILSGFKWELVATELFNIAVNDFDAKTSARFSLVLLVTKLAVSGS